MPKFSMARGLCERLDRILHDRLDDYAHRWPRVLPDPIGDDLDHALKKLRATPSYMTRCTHGMIRVHTMPDRSTLIEEWHSDGWLELTARDAGRQCGVSFLLDTTVTG